MARFTHNVPIVGDPKVRTFFQVLAVASAFYSYRGFAFIADAGASDWMGHFPALVFAIASSVAIYLIWAYSLPVVARLETPKERAMGMGLSALSCIMIAALSSWLNVAGIAGGSALTSHMHAQVMAFDQAVASRYDATIAIQQFRPDLQHAHVVYLDRRQSEIQFGAYTGVPGAPGTIEQILGDISDRFDQLDGTVGKQLTGLGTSAEKARESLAKMRALANADGEPSDRLQDLTVEANTLRAILSGMDPKASVAALRRALRAMPRELETVKVTGRTKKSRLAQQEALVRIKSELGDSIADLEHALDRLDAHDVPPIPVVERINPIEAVWRYAGDHIPYWAAGLAIDFTPTLIMLFAMVLMAARGREGVYADAVLSKTVGDLIASLHGTAIIRESKLDRKSLDRSFNDAIGRLEDTDDNKNGGDDA